MTRGFCSASGAQFMRQGKDDVAIRNRQNLGGSISKPLVACPAVAFWAMTVAARPVGNHLVPAMVTLLDVCAKRSSTARTDVSECLPLLGRQHIPPAIEEFLTVLTENIGDF